MESPVSLVCYLQTQPFYYIINLKIIPKTDQSTGNKNQLHNICICYRNHLTNHSVDNSYC